MTSVLGAAVIGAGILGSRHARVYTELDGTRLLAVVDINPDRAKAVAEKHGVPWFTDYEEMLAALGSELHVVSVATPDFAHFGPTRACLEAGVDVLVEKPLTTDVAEARKLVALARERQRVLHVNYSLRWLPEHRRVQELLQSGELGKPTFIESHRWDAAWVPQRMISWAPQTSPIYFMSSHDIDLITYWLNDRVESVSAMAHYGVLSPTLGGQKVVDGLVALLRMKGGTVVNLHSSWILPETFGAAADTYMELLGSKGAIWLYGNRRELKLYTPDRAESVVYGGPVVATEVQGRLTGSFVESLRSFLAACRARDLEAPASAARTVHVVEVQQAICEAAESGGIVRLS